MVETPIHRRTMVLASRTIRGECRTVRPRQGWPCRSAGRHHAVVSSQQSRKVQYGERVATSGPDACGGLADRRIATFMAGKFDDVTTRAGMSDPLSGVMGVAIPIKQQRRLARQPLRATGSRRFIATTARATVDDMRRRSAQRTASLVNMVSMR